MPRIITNTPISPRSARFGAEASLCQYFYLGAQAAGALKDYQGGIDAPKNTGGAGFLDAAAWANAGFATTGGGVDEFFDRPANSGHDFTLAGRALVFALRFKKSTPGSNEIVLGGYTATTAPGGLQLTANSTGSLGLAINAADNTSLALTITSTYTPLDGNEHLCCWFVPPDAVNARFFVDGLSASSASAATIAGKNCAGGNILRIGSARASSAAKVAQFGSLQQYSVPCATLASINYDAVAQFMFRHPHQPVPDWMWGI